MLTVILLDVRWLEILRVLDVVKNSAEGFEAFGIVYKLIFASCVDDVPCVHYGIGYFLPVVAAVVAAIQLRPRSLVCWWLGAPGTMDACDFLIFLVSLILLFQLLLTVMASGGTACLRYYCCGRPGSGAMKRGQGVLPLELFHSMVSELDDALCLRISWHLHEAQGSFCHRGDRSSEYWIRDVIGVVVKITWLDSSTLSNSRPALSPALISCSAGCLSSFIFVLRGVLGQISIWNLIRGFIRIMLAGSTPILLVDYGDQAFWSIAFQV